MPTMPYPSKRHHQLYVPEVDLRYDDSFPNRQEYEAERIHHQRQFYENNRETRRPSPISSRPIRQQTERDRSSHARRKSPFLA